MPTPTPVATPELFGIPVATLALIVASFGFLISLVALGWQIAKHFLDGGRVNVFLNAVALEPESATIRVNRSGRWEMSSKLTKSAHWQFIELAQLVVENPGRTPITVFTPGLRIYGDGTRRHRVSPRKFKLDGFGQDDALNVNTFRLDPFDRVTFLLDHWSVIESAQATTKRRKLTVRGSIEIAGRRKPTLSSRGRRWRIPRESWSVYGNATKLEQRTLVWREVFRRKPDFESGFAVTSAMRRFAERPPVEEFAEALRDESKSEGQAGLGYVAFAAFDVLERYASRTLPWSTGLHPVGSNDAPNGQEGTMPTPDRPETD